MSGKGDAVNTSGDNIKPSAQNVQASNKEAVQHTAVQKAASKKTLGKKKSEKEAAVPRRSEAAKHFEKTTHFKKQEILALTEVYNRLKRGPDDSANPAVIPRPAHRRRRIGANFSASLTAIDFQDKETSERGAGSLRDTGTLDKIKFRTFLQNTFHISGDIILDRIFRILNRTGDGNLSLVEWLEGMSMTLRGTLQERTEFAYKVYDLNGDGVITKDEMIHLLKPTLIPVPFDEDPEEGVRDLLELSLRLMDTNRDSRISFAEFEAAVRKQPLLLEAFGQCMPDPYTAAAFLATCMEQTSRDCLIPLSKKFSVEAKSSKKTHYEQSSAEIRESVTDMFPGMPNANTTSRSSMTSDNDDDEQGSGVYGSGSSTERPISVDPVEVAPVSATPPDGGVAVGEGTAGPVTGPAAAGDIATAAGGAPETDTGTNVGL